MSRYGDGDWDEDYPNQWALQEKVRQLALEGQRGKEALRELEAALLALPKPRLIEGAICKEGDVCAVGALALHRRVTAGEPVSVALAALEEQEIEDAWGTAQLAVKLGLTRAWGYAVSQENDDEEWSYSETPEERYARVLRWVRTELARPALHRPPPKPPKAAAAPSQTRPAVDQLTLL